MINCDSWENTSVYCTNCCISSYNDNHQQLYKSKSQNDDYDSQMNDDYNSWMNDDYDSWMNYDIA